MDEDLHDLPGHQLPPDRWQVSDDGRLWTRIHNSPRRKLYVPELTADVPVHLFLPERATDIRRGSPNPEHIRIRDEWRLPNADRELHYVWTGTTTFFINTEQLSDNDGGYSPGTPLPDDERRSDDEGHHGGGHLSEAEQEPPGAGPSTTNPGDTSHGGNVRGLDPLPVEQGQQDQHAASISPMSQETLPWRTTPTSRFLRLNKNYTNHQLKARLSPNSVREWKDRQHCCSSQSHHPMDQIDHKSPEQPHTLESPCLLMRTLAPPWTWTSSRSLVCQLDGLWKMGCS